MPALLALKSGPARNPKLKRAGADLETIVPRPRGLTMENLESRLLMHANGAEDAEHSEVFALVSDSAVTYKTAASGSWTDQSIWLHATKIAGGATGFVNDGTTPGTNDNVVISANTTVSVDTTLARDSGGNRVDIHTIRDDGTLTFNAHANTSLLVDTLIVNTKGTLTIGTASDRVDATHTAKIIFADNGDIDTTWDPYQFSRGLVSHGNVSVYGSTVTSFVTNTSTLNAKATSITLASIPTGWSVGDRLVISGLTSANSKNENQDDQIGISAINGNTITFDTALNYNHAANLTYISDTTRNVSFTSESVLLGDTAIGHRGHTMFMHNENVHIDAAGFYGLGRTNKLTTIDDPVLVADPDHPGQFTTDVINPTAVNSIDGTHRVYVPVVDANGNKVLNADGTVKLEIAKTGLNPRGRYAVHFHRDDSDTATDVASINDSAVVDSPGWGIVNHSSNVNITNNTVFNATGASYVTEAGDERGTFIGNIAMHAKGSGDGVESRKEFQDFGHEGDGFWLQGPNVTVDNNVVTGQAHAGYVLFPVGLNEAGIGVVKIEADKLADPSWANGAEFVNVGDVPLREFKGNVAVGDGEGYESWFTLLDVKDNRQTVIENFTVSNVTGGSAINTPYTANVTFKNITLTGNLTNAWQNAFSRNHRTAAFTYDHVNVQGFGTGIDVPVNGHSTIIGGTFNNRTSILISTSNSPDRVVDFVDTAADPMTFLNIKATDKNNFTAYDIKLAANFNPHLNDLTTLFNPDVVRMGTVRYNGKQLYYKEQAANYVPFPAGNSASFVPAEFIGKTNQQLWNTYGLAVGGAVAPPDATASDPAINALIGSPTTYAPTLKLNSEKYYSLISHTANSYALKYTYNDPTNSAADKNGNVVVIQKNITLHTGWNIITQTVNGHVRSLLVYGDNTPPTFVADKTVATAVNTADLANGATFVIRGNIFDDSFGHKDLYMTIKLNDPKHVSAIKTRADGTKYVTVTFTISDFAGNKSVVALDLTVTATNTLQKDLKRKNITTMAASTTLNKLLGNMFPDYATTLKI